MRRAGVTGDTAPPDPLLNKDPRRQDAARTTASADAGAKPKTAAGAREGQGNRISQSEANALVAQEGVPFREAYRRVGQKLRKD